MKLKVFPKNPPPGHQRRSADCGTTCEVNFPLERRGGGGQGGEIKKIKKEGEGTVAPWLLLFGASEKGVNVLF